VRAYRSLARCQDPANFKGWLFRIVSNQCKTYLARNARRRTEPLGTLATWAAPDDPGHEAAASDLRRFVRQAVNRLPPEQSEALILKYVHAMGVSEIAHLLEVSESALKMRLLRARRALLHELKGVFDDVA
jgi:RNA polymerase sigma-70 factor (ECF subfamily)